MQTDGNGQRFGDSAGDESPGGEGPEECNCRRDLLALRDLFLLNSF